MRSAACSSPPGFAKLRIELVEIGLNLLAAAFVDELPPPHASRVGQAHPGGSELALDVVDAFAEHDQVRAHSDRKSTRLNSSHEWISYAVFCLKKKTKREEN